MLVAYMSSENARPRARVPRSPTAPQRFNRVYTVPLAERRLSTTDSGERGEGQQSCLLFRRVVTFSYFRLNHHGCVAALVELGFVGDGSYHVAGRKSEGSSECRERCDEHRDDNFNDLLFGHNSEFLVVHYIKKSFHV